MPADEINIHLFRVAVIQIMRQIENREGGSNMLKIDEKTGYLTLPGLRDLIRVRDGYIQGETGWCRVATDEEEAMFALAVEYARNRQDTSTVQVTGGQHPEEP